MHYSRIICNINQSYFNMKEQCEMLEKCGFFNNYQGNAEVVKQGWIRMYCETTEKSEKCKTKQIRKETGKPPSDNMCPTGKYILSPVL